MSNNSSKQASIHGLGLAWPKQTLSSAAIEERHGLPSGWIAKRTGILSRHVRGPGETTISLSTAAIRQACEDAHISPNELDGLIFSGVSREQLIPCTASLIARELSVHGLTCCDIDATCLSFLVGLDYATMQIVSGRKKYVAVVSCEIATPCLDWEEPESAVLMGDGAAAVIVGSARDNARISPLHMRTYPDGAHLAELRRFGTRQLAPDTVHTDKDNLFHMQGPKLFRFAAQHIKEIVSTALKAADWKISDVNALVPHQASAHAVRSISKHCGFKPEQILENYAHAGNCLSASIPLLLTEACTDGRIATGDRLLLVGTAAGVTLGAMSIIR